MGLFDTVKAKAGELAADAERAGKVTAAQARLVTLQGDLRKAERELGQTAFALVELGEPLHPDLEAAVAAVREAHDALREREREIAELRGGAESSAPGGPPEEPPASPAATPAAVTEPGPAAGPADEAAADAGVPAAADPDGAD